MADTSLMPNTFVGSVYKKFKKEIFDNITDHQVIMKEIDKAGGIETVDGGYSLACNVNLTEASGFVSFQQLDTFNMFNEDLITQAEFDIKQFYAPIVLSGFDVWRNGARAEQIFPLTEKYIKVIRDSAYLAFNQRIHTSDGVIGEGSTDLGGLALLIETSGSWSTVGGIDSNAVTRWRNNLQGSAGSFAATGRGYMTTAYNNALHGVYKPTLFVTTQAIDEAFHASLVVNEQYILTEKKPAYVDAGIPHKMYLGLPWVWDTDAVSGTIKLINADVLKLWIGSGHDFDMTDFVRPYNQDAKAAVILLYAQMGVEARNCQSAIAGITTP
jgi:hypothetical protein